MIGTGKSVRSLFREFRRGGDSCSKEKIDDLKILTAKLLIERILEKGFTERIQENEFKVFSQFGDDGIIQYLTSRVEVLDRRFVEFGVENYTEANTRFLLINDNWSGLVIDSRPENIYKIRNDEIFWKHDLTAVQAFVTRENINELLSCNKFSGPIGLLSIDIDGNDYWVWEAIECIDPSIVIVEYNSVFGNSSAVTIPYDPDFDRAKAHYSRLYWGASLGALSILAERKGYFFVGSNSAGNNAYFVKKTAIGALKPISPQEGFVESKFRESRDAKGGMTYLSGKARLSLIGDMQVYDVGKATLVKLDHILSSFAEPPLKKITS